MESFSWKMKQKHQSESQKETTVFVYGEAGKGRAVAACVCVHNCFRTCPLCVVCVCVFVFMCVCMHLCVCVCVSVYMCVCMCICTCVCVLCVSLHVPIHSSMHHVHMMQVHTAHSCPTIMHLKCTTNNPLHAQLAKVSWVYTIHWNIQQGLTLFLCAEHFHL